ncbi:hypothetical protein HOLleu_24304 [Holothuria leucospilota]|uniref:Uncharacterized protein n=1 Tax=Holothuria leucospilota TaxID=206669 RepID=A0A9Q1BWN8_HOLLE|nr:hypothetical protein HOLleu_24304 [Holothuria leucospilota]
MSISEVPYIFPTPLYWPSKPKKHTNRRRCHYLSSTPNGQAYKTLIPAKQTVLKPGAGDYSVIWRHLDAKNHKQLKDFCTRNH